MRVIPFIYAVVLTAFLCVMYISKHNTLMSLRIHTVALENKIHSVEASLARMDVEIASFFDPKHLETIARKAQYAKLQPVEKTDLIYMDDL